MVARSSEYHGPERRANGAPHGRRKGDKIHPVRWRLLSVWIVVTSTALILMYGEIQRSRKESCVRQYQALAAVVFEAYGGEHASDRAKAYRDRVLRVTDPSRCDDVIRVPWYVWWD